jgi:sarcosine oxidase, subunit gamma
VTVDPTLAAGSLAAKRRSPAAHLADRMSATGSPATVGLRELPFRSQYEILNPGGDGWPRPGRATGDGPRHVLWLGPDWYLLVDDEPMSEVDLPAGAVDVSAQRTILELVGPLAPAVLAHGCALDLHPRAFAAGSCAQTMLAKAQVVLHQTGPEPTYRILVRASFADYLVHWLLDAMTEYVSETAGADP